MIDFDAIILDGEYCLRQLDAIETRRVEYAETLSQIVAATGQTPPICDYVEVGGPQASRNSGVRMWCPTQKGCLKFAAIRLWREIVAAATEMEPTFRAYALVAQQVLTESDADPAPLHKLTHSIRSSAGLTSPQSRQPRHRGIHRPSDSYPSDRRVVEALQEAEWLSQLTSTAKRFISDALVQARQLKRRERDSARRAPPVVAPGEKRAKRVDEIRRLAEDHVRRSPFPGVRAFAKLLGCSAATMSKAIRMSPRLRNAKARKQSNGDVPTVPMNDAIAGTTCQATEPDPLDSAAAAENNEILERLVSAARPSVRKAYRQQLAQMPLDALVKLEDTLADDPDAGVRARARSCRSR
jgi:hypothetical protein